MKHLFFCIAALFVFCLTDAQDTIAGKKILMVAFNPEYYLSDAEQDLMQQNKRSPENYRLYLRRSLDNKIAAEVEKLIPCYSLLSDTNRTSVETTYDFYNHSALQYKPAYGVKLTLKDGGVKRTGKPVIFNQHDAARYNRTAGNLQCMDNTVSDTSWLKTTAAHYQSDLILSINQFEIRTNYNSCIDIANKVYRREVHVHYTLMTSSGRSLQGNIAIGAFPSDSNRVEEISEKVFPEIAELIATQLSGPLRTN